MHRLELIGEDVSELLHEIATSFEIEFTPGDIVEARTAGDLFDCVLRKVGPLGATRCLTSVAFYRLRQSLVDVSGVDRRSIRPDTPLKDLLQPRRARAWLRHAEVSLGLRMPGMQLSVQACALFLLALIGLLTAPVFYPKFGMRAWMVIAFLFVTASLQPPNFPCETFGEFVKKTIALNHAKLQQEAGGSSTGQAWEAFRQLLSHASGIEGASIARETRFPEDLGIY